MLKVGDSIPSFRAKLTDGREITDKDIKGKWVVLFFFPKAFTPGCTKEVCSIRDGIEKIKSLGAEVYGVSKDKLETQRKFKEKYNLNYELISDEKGEMIKAFGVSGLFGIAKRKTFIISPEGKIAYVFDKVKVSEHDVEVAQVLEKLVKGQNP